MNIMINMYIDVFFGYILLLIIVVEIKIIYFCLYLLDFYFLFLLVVECFIIYNLIFWSMYIVFDL